MASVNFYLEKRKDPKTGKLKEKNIPIFLHFHFDSTKMIFSTGEKVNRNHWNENKQKVKASVSGGADINKKLEDQAEKLKSVYRQAQLYGIQPDKEYITQQFKKQGKEQPLSFFEVYQKYVEARQQEYTPSSLKKIRSSFNHLAYFEKYRNKSITFDEIDESFLDELKSYFYDECGHTHNTVAKNIKALKSFLNWALKRNYHNQTKFQDFKVKEKEGQVIFITEDEYDRLIQLEDLSYNFRFARDLFIFLWLTGLRVSDVKNLKKSNYKDHNHLSLTDWKTRKDNKLPLVKRAINIIEEHKCKSGDHLFPPFSPQVLNRRLKKLGQLAGIDEQVTVIRFWKGERIEKTFPKYELLSTKLGRKSFITNALLKGMDHETVMNFSNHNDYKTLQHYIGKAEEHKRQEVEKIFGDK